MTLRVSSPGLLPRLFNSGGGWPGPSVPLPGLGSLATLQAGLPLRAGFARCGGGTRAPGRGRLLRGYGASGGGRTPTPDRPSFGLAARVRYPPALGARGVDVGTLFQDSCC